MREQESNIIAQQLLEIERTKNDSTHMFHAIKQMQHLKPKAPLLINTNEGALTANEKEQTELISQHFKQQFFKNQEIIPTIPPTPMTKLLQSTFSHVIFGESKAILWQLDSGVQEQLTS